MVSFVLNGKQVSARSEDSTPLLWVIRDELKLTGTKFGCGAALCGACTVHVNGKAVRSCTTPLSAVKGAQVTTIEGLSPELLASAAEGLDRRGSPAVRLLPVGADHESGRAPRREPEAHARADREAHGRQHLPLRHVSPHRARDRARLEGGLR